MKIMIFTLVIIAAIVVGGLAFIQTYKSRNNTTTTVLTPTNDSACLLDQGCGNQPPGNANYASLTSKELASVLDKKDFFFVNVHVPYKGEIKKTDAFISYNEIANNLDKLPKDKNAKIVLYCRSGRMSGIAAKELTKLGYTNVSHLTGGMIDWEQNGYEIIKK